MTTQDVVLVLCMLVGFAPVVYGVSGTLSFSRIFDRPRRWACGVDRDDPNFLQGFLAGMLSCMFCTGMWVGGVYGLLPAVVGLFPWKWAALSVVLCAPAGASASYLVDLVTNRLELAHPLEDSDG